MENYIWYIYIVVIIAVLYFFGIRPERKRKKQAEDMRNALKVGDKITTIGGITGKVVYLNDKNFVIETGDDRVRIEMARWSLSSIGNSNEPENK